MPESSPSAAELEQLLNVAGVAAIRCRELQETQARACSTLVFGTSVAHAGILLVALPLGAAPIGFGAAILGGWLGLQALLRIHRMRAGVRLEQHVLERGQAAFNQWAPAVLVEVSAVRRAMFDIRAQRLGWQHTS